MKELKFRIVNRPLKIKYSSEYTFPSKHLRIMLTKNSILLPVFDERRNIQVGFIFRGNIGITADLLVHSLSGAIGEIIEEAYTTMFLFPQNLIFVKENEVKEIPPLENISDLEKLLQRTSFKLAGAKFYTNNKEEGVMFYSFDHNHLWLINHKHSILLKEGEIIIRSGEKRLIWVTKDEITLIDKNGKLRTTKDIHILNQTREILTNFVNTPLKILFDKFHELFYSF